MPKLDKKIRMLVPNKLSETEADLTSSSLLAPEYGLVILAPECGLLVKLPPESVVW